jgi:outer membrane lipoprotein LolB
MRKLFFIACMVISIILSACTTQITPPFDHPTYQSKPWLKRKTSLHSGNWDIQGALSIQNRDKTQMGTFTWKQIGPCYAINFYGPLNLGAIGIAGQPGKVTLNKPLSSFSAPTPEALMWQQLGWYLPVTNMYYWVRGFPAPGISRKQERDKFGHMIFLQQQGWTIRFAGYQSSLYPDLPLKIWMDNQQLHVKLVINSWDLT